MMVGTGMTGIAEARVVDGNKGSEIGRMGTVIGELPMELSEGVVGTEIIGDMLWRLGVGISMNSLKGELSCKLYGFWLL